MNQTLKLPVGIENFEDIRKLGFYYIDTVSYTHLDVYKRQVYSKFKTAPTEEEREKFRKEYLDRRGIPENFRW